MSVKPKPIELAITGITRDITSDIRGCTKIHIEQVYGDLLFFKDKLQMEDAIKTHKINSAMLSYKFPG